MTLENLLKLFPWQITVNNVICSLEISNALSHGKRWRFRYNNGLFMPYYATDENPTVAANKLLEMLKKAGLCNLQ